MNLPDKVLRGMDRWIQGEPEWEPDEERSEAEAWLEADAARGSEMTGARSPYFAGTLLSEWVWARSLLTETSVVGNPPPSLGGART